MAKLSGIQIISVWLITLNSFAMNVIMTLKGIKSVKDSSQKYTGYEKSQIEKVLEKSTIKVAIYKNTAYWVINNVIYKAKVDKEGRVLQDQAEEIDVFTLSDREVDNLLTILDSMNN